ncbi:MAG: HDIG domain-containing metalloprotein [Aggregatilineales bacterium]
MFRLPGFIERLLPLERAERQRTQLLLIVLLGAIFVLALTVVVAFDSVFPGQSTTTALRIGDVAPDDIRAPFSITYISEVLTERRRQEAFEAVAPIYDPPDPNVSRQQTQLLQQIVEFIDNVRGDRFASLEQKAADINQINALTLEPEIITTILTLDEETWRAVTGESFNVLERVMRESIREADMPLILDNLPTQVGVRFNAQTAAVVVALVEDLVRPNRFLNPQATENARRTAAAATPTESRSFERGQVVIRGGTRIDAVDFEALEQLGLLETADRRSQAILQASLASLIVTIAMGLYIVRVHPTIAAQPHLIGILAALFLFILVGARLFSGSDQIYLYPAAALALILIALTTTDLAVVAVLLLAMLIGVMLRGSLEVMAFVGLGGMVGALMMRRPERLNSYFFAGLMIALVNMIVVTLFNLELFASRDGTTISLIVVFALLNGVFSATAALAAIYAITILFNLTTSLKLVELSQPSQPLVQRLLREAPGTYQHSLQVANLCEQAASAIGANAELVRVASLYHDVGKMLNPSFFVENQADGVNPHDELNDPYRSADIIISHVTDGDRLARQHRLPARIRDFILEHHGTTLVVYFYNQALQQVQDEEAVDIEQFRYPGPRPRSRETAIMMLADSCESTVRARKPSTRQEISDIVTQIIDNRIRDGQLDDCNLTLKEIERIRGVFIEMLQAVFHPRINYPVLSSTGKTITTEALLPTVEGQAAHIATKAEHEGERGANLVAKPKPEKTEQPATRRATHEMAAITLDSEDDLPLPEVPPLRRSRPASSSNPQENFAASPNGSANELGREMDDATNAVDRRSE